MKSWAWRAKTRRRGSLGWPAISLFSMPLSACSSRSINKCKKANGRIWAAHSDHDAVGSRAWSAHLPARGMGHLGADGQRIFGHSRQPYFLCGLALGYADSDASVNSLESPRAPMDEVVTYLFLSAAYGRHILGFVALAACACHWSQPATACAPR